MKISRLGGIRVLAAIIVGCLGSLVGWASVVEGQLEPASKKSSLPEESDVRLSGVDSIIGQAIRDGNIPGAVLVVGHEAKVVYRKAYGERALEPRREPMTV